MIDNIMFDKKSEVNKLIKHLHKVANELNAKNVTWDIIQLKKKLYYAIDNPNKPRG